MSQPQTTLVQQPYVDFFKELLTEPDAEATYGDILKSEAEVCIGEDFDEEENGFLPVSREYEETFTSSDDELHEAYENRACVVSSLSPTRYITEKQDPIFAFQQPEPVAKPRWPTRGRGRASARGRKCSKQVKSSVWIRGSPLIERFLCNEDLPEDLLTKITEQNRQGRKKPTHRKRNSLCTEENESESEVDLSDSQEFEWEPLGEWQPKKETFLSECSGPTSNFDNVYDAFRTYWDDSILSHIVTETNRFAQGIDSPRFQNDWYETTIDEILILFAFWMMLGVIQMPSIKSCFSKVPILRTDVFRTMFTESRYWNLNRAFHLVDLSEDANRPDDSDLMGPVVDHLNEKFQKSYRLEQNICIGESLTPWKSALKAGQSAKTIKPWVGVKTLMLCESSTEYLWSLCVPLGRRKNSASLSSSANSVIQLMRPLLNSGHILYINNNLTSVALAKFLKQRRTDCVGTLRSTSKDVPLEIQESSLSEGEYIARRSGDVAVVTLQDRQRLTCLSTCHDMTQIKKAAKPGRPSEYKLQLINDYNREVRGAEHLHKMLSSYLMERKHCTEWFKKFFKRLLHISVHNTRILLEKSTKRKCDSLSVRLALVQEILDRHLTKILKKSRREGQGRMTNERLTGRHFIRAIPITEEMRQKVVHATNLGRRLCFWCSSRHGRRTKTRYECPSCNVTLCFEGCFEEYHTIP